MIIGGMQDDDEETASESRLLTTAAPDQSSHWLRAARWLYASVCNKAYPVRLSLAKYT